MTKARFAKFLAWLGGIATAAGQFLAPKYAHIVLTAGSTLTAWAAHNASDTSAGHPDGVNTLPSQRGFARGPAILILGIAAVIGLFFLGCTQSQVVSNVQKVEVGLNVAKNLLPEAQQLVTGLQLDSATTQEFNGYITEAGPAIDGLIAKCDAYIANPGNNAYQSLLNAFYDFSAGVNSKQVLLAVKIKNPDSQAQATKWFARFSTVFTVGLSILEANATKQQNAAITKTARVSQPASPVDRPFAIALLRRMRVCSSERLCDAAIRSY
jgi:hypothetical protein